jgi:hypothetical protein
LVTKAKISIKGEFLAHWLIEAGTYVIKQRLNLDPGQFWRAAKGRDFVELPKLPVKLLLF